MAVLKPLLGIPLFLVVGAMLFHGLLIGWGFVSDFRSKAARIAMRSCFVLFCGAVIALFASRMIDFFA